ncbi:MAG TPA: bifunctional DNA primase/polymerase [Stellaceae bacterium]|nr:bifunctional DNA primase/polymerase [Stellaceae bacterium]
MPNVLDYAVELATQGYRVHPCGADKRPLCKGWPDLASSGTGEVRALWREHGGPLIGVVTGEKSGIDVLDIDMPRHTEAAAWWREIEPALPPTRIHRTRSGGLHVLFRHAPGLRNWTGRPVPGVDGRADGGYAIWWPAAGEPVLSNAEPGDWQPGLLDEVRRTELRRIRWPVADRKPAVGDHSTRYARAALDLAAERVANAPAGSRNTALNREAYMLARFVSADLVGVAEAAEVLATAALAAGLSARETAATITSVLRAGGVA